MRKRKSRLIKGTVIDFESNVRKEPEIKEVSKVKES